MALRNPAVQAHAERILELHPEIRDAQEQTTGAVNRVMSVVLKDETIISDFVGAAIRYTAMCGEVGQCLLERIGESPDLIGLMSIGDVDLPPAAREVADQMIDSAHAHHKELIGEEGYGYDLTSQGSPRARTSMISYFDQHYGFSSVSGLMEKLARNSTIVGGGMRGLDDIATAMVDVAELEKKTHRFIHPDNSFGTWHSITAKRSRSGKIAKVHEIPTAQKDLLHTTPEQVDAFYDANPPTDLQNDSWCLTPVGNPSGTYSDAQTLTSTCQRIVARNPRAKIILDCTYVRTLNPTIAKALLAGIIGDPAVLDRVIFVESFSKTNGFAGERVGAYFAANDDVYRGVQNTNMTLSAGNGRQKSALVLALTNPTEAQAATIHELHQFWARERRGLHAYLIENGRFTDLFEKDQSHIKPEQLEQPVGLYIFLKLKEGVTGREVLEKTGCLGVETTMGSEKYIRFAVGKLQKPTYAKYLND